MQCRTLDEQDENITESPVKRIRFVMKKIKKSEQLQIRFNTCCSTVGLAPSKPTIDVKTRWNSTYEMLSWAVKYKLPLNLICDTNSDFLLLKINTSEWELVETVVKYLKPFKTLTNMLSGEKYCTISMVVLGINILIDKLEKWAFQLDATYRNYTDKQIIFALNAARDKILKHYKKTNWMYCVSLILDPRHKREAFNLTTWGNELEASANTKFEEILVNQYLISISDEQNDKRKSIESSDEFDINLGDIFLKNNENSFSQSSNPEEAWRIELNYYFGAKRATEDTDILSWWKLHEKSFPTLSKMARDFFTIMATSVPSERTFSRAALIMRKHRNRLNSASMRSLVCLNSWFGLHLPS